MIEGVLIVSVEVAVRKNEFEEFADFSAGADEHEAGAERGGVGLTFDVGESEVVELHLVFEILRGEVVEPEIYVAEYEWFTFAIDGFQDQRDLVFGGSTPIEGSVRRCFAHLGVPPEHDIEAFRDGGQEMLLEHLHVARGIAGVASFAHVEILLRFRFAQRRSRRKCHVDVLMGL